MNRTEQREQIFMLLFRVEFNQKSDMEEQCTLFLRKRRRRFPKRIRIISGPNMRRSQNGCRRSTV